MRVLIAVALLMCGTLGLVAFAMYDRPKQEKAQPTVKSTGELVIQTVPRPANFMLIGFNGNTLVTIHPDGTIEYGKDYRPDKAAKIFWEAIGRDMPCKELRKR